MTTEVVFDKAQPSLSLYNLVLDYEKHPRKLEDAPKDFIDYFSLPALAICLDATYPQLPYYNEEKVEATMKNRDFSSISQLANFIKSNFKTDIERYFAIYTWVAHNITFDVDAFFSNKYSYLDPEDIFKHRTTRSVYKLVLSLVSQTEISYSFTQLNCFGKGYGFKPNTPPPSPFDDDSPLLVEINGVTFISDPAWGSGHIGNDRKYHPKYNPSLFLKPYVKGLHRHFPIKTVLPIRISYSKFLSINCFEGWPFDFRLESHPFQKYYCDSGYMKFYFSCNPKVKEIDTYLKYYDDQDKETDYNQDIKLKIISESPRKRFYVQAAFQKTGKYRVRVWLENDTVATYFINSTKSIEIVPFIKSKYGKNVLPISPDVKTTKLNTNYAIIKLQMAKENAGVLIDTVKGSQELPRNYTSAIMLVPNNDDLREIWVCVPFPSSGFYEVHLYLYNGTNYTESMIYEFDVNIKNSVENPVIYQFINEKKTFAPITKNQLQISPNDSAIIMKPGSFSFTAIVPKNQKILYNLKPKPKGQTIFQDSSTSVNYNSSYDKVTTTFTAKSPGLYDLLAFLGDDNVWSQFYYVTNNLPSESSSSNPSNFLSTITKEPVILERPFIFPDDPNAKPDDTSSNVKNFAPANSALLEEASSASLSFLQKAANANSEFLKNASSANSEFLRNANCNPSFLEEAMNMSASFLQQAGTLNALFYQQATSMVSEFLKVAEAISKGKSAPSLSSNPVFQKKDIFVPPKVEVSSRYKMKKPVTNDQSIQCTLSDDEYQERRSKHQESSAQTNNSVKNPIHDTKVLDEKPKKIVETVPEPIKTIPKPKNDSKVLDDKPKKTIDDKPKISDEKTKKIDDDKPKVSDEKTKKIVDDKPKVSDDKPKKIIEKDVTPEETTTPTILREVKTDKNSNLYKNLKILDNGFPPKKSSTETSSSNKNLTSASSSSTKPIFDQIKKEAMQRNMRSKTLEPSAAPPNLSDDKSSTSNSKSNFKNLINNFQSTAPIRPLDSHVVPPPKPVDQAKKEPTIPPPQPKQQPTIPPPQPKPQPTIPPPQPKQQPTPQPKPKEETQPAASGGNRSFKDLINRFNRQ